MRALRHDVPVDGAIHAIECGAVLHVDCRLQDVVTLWTLDDRTRLRRFQVFATGEAVPDRGWYHVGTALSPAMEAHPRGGRASSRGELVWHLFEGEPA